MVEVPANKPIRLRLHDIKLGIGTDKGDTPGVAPDTIRIRHNETQYQYPLDEGIITVLPVPEDPQALDVEFLPPGGFELASVQTLLVQAGDFNRIENPPPIRARFMRDERITFSTVGYGAKISDIHNQGYADGQTQPPSIALRPLARLLAMASPSWRIILRCLIQIPPINTPRCWFTSLTMGKIPM